MKKKLIIAVAGLCILLGSGFLYMMYYTSKEAEGIKLHDVNMQNIEDGTYVGEQRIGLVQVKVGISVSKHKIQDINLIKHENGLGQGAEAVIPQMIKQNNIEVDTISGATISSKAIMKACENAFMKK